VLVAAMVAATSLLLPAEAHAQHYGHGFGHGGYGHGFGYGGYGHGFGYGGYGHGFGYGGYGPNQYSNDGAVRIEVGPKKSRKDIQVYVDEGHAGVVNDFDGAFQRLYLPLGKNEIELRLDGYKTIRLAIFVSPGKTYHIRGQMEPLA
ncbi:carboxypeptidase-like regulatory domain-containing protein, partial [Acidobacteria bacterium AH-259-O06]|nr:carboxypeptidase-like regulatory domain-containing protein [Acidobacteria bacterium AH-259-O06]